MSTTAITDANKSKLDNACMALQKASKASLGTEMQTTQTNLATAEAAIDVVEALAPTADEKAALAGVGTPSAANKFLNNDDARLPTADEKAGIAANTPTAANPLQGLTEIQSQTWKAAVRFSSTAALPACTAAGAGVGKTLTGNANGALAAQDGVTPVAGNRCLVPNQAAPEDNGIYTLTQLGTGSTPFILTRAVDFDTSVKAASGAQIPVAEGNIYKDRVFSLITNDPITLDTTGLGFDVARHAIKVFSETIGHADLTAAATDEDITLTTPPVNCIFLGGCIETDVVFSGGAVSDITAEIGDSADPNEMAAAVDVFTGAAVGLQDGIPTTQSWQGVQLAYLPIVRFSAVGANVSVLTAGSLIAHLYYLPIDPLS